MGHPGRGKCQKRKRDLNVPLQVVDCTPLQLWAWWNDMGLIEQGIIFKYLGFLTRIMQVEPKRDVIEALLSFWDPTNNIFRFSNFEMTPTLEEIAGFTGFGVRLHHQRLIAPRGISINKFFQHLNICKVREKSLDKGWISLQFLYDRYGREDGFKKFGRTLNNKGSFETWKEHRRFAFMVAFLGTMVFPRRGENINILLTGVVNILIEKKNYTIIPVILADIYRALTVCQKGKRFFEGCNMLLQLWIVEHLYRPPTVARFIQDRSDYITSHAKRVEKYRCPEGVPLPEGLAQKNWDGCLVMGIGTMVKERHTGETHPEYSNWLEQQPRLQELRANLELARAALTQQQAEFEEERAKATQRETLLRGQVDLATIRGSQVAELAIRGWNQTCNSLQSKLHRLADRTAQMGLDYQEINYEQFLAEVPEFAEYLMTSVQDVHQSVGGHVTSPSP
ncbi:hypothetical protein KY290_021455 [Solanum tuberosum]|uniref:Aminotransferase-like plant mobile domain-containing protein n=1 Tax=Solanum tuberosum TaxID=4113 RepID=A0ABQ7V1M8_SOLTU|nr:hypothetical protein KY289_020606 [Solanum tuberosum]KAH0693263.1 hypothetical protein KY285_020360 [Solanum tuberosum]KAH0757962.1 hypothetical protein KY290_021455 [Solanum tuberosum]